MKTATATPNMPTQTHEYASANIGAQYRWDTLSEPGTYFSNWSGHLIRVPDYALREGFSPVLEILGKEPMIVTKLSDNPFVCISKARSIAANLDLPVNF